MGLAPFFSARKRLVSVALALSSSLGRGVTGRRQDMRSILRRLAVAAVSLGALVLAGGAHVRL
jgi:hypothetical protein